MNGFLSRLLNRRASGDERERSQQRREALREIRDSGQWHEQVPVVHRSLFAAWAIAMSSGLVLSFTSGEAVSREDLLRVLDAMHYALKAEQHHHRLLMQTEEGGLSPAPDAAAPEEAR